jgi:hypothetical protein
MSDEKTVLEDLMSIWPALAMITAWFGRLEWRSRDNARANVALEKAMERMEVRISDVRREDLARVEVSRKETNAALDRISTQISDLAKELREQGRRS